MQTHYSNNHSSAEVVQSTLTDVEGLLELVRVWTDPEARRQGSATALLTAICADADATASVLLLRPVAFCNKSDANLVKWYKKFDFAVIQRRPVVLMARVPSQHMLRRHKLAIAANEAIYG